MKVIESDISWNAKGVLLVNQLEKSHIITEANNTYLLRQLQKKIKILQHEEEKKALSPGQHSRIKCGDGSYQYRLEFVHHMLYSSNLAPADY